MPLDHPERADLTDRDIVEGQIISEDMPTRNELILRGRAALADTNRNPDDLVDGETDQMLIDSRPAGTTAAIHWGWGRWIWWCGLPEIGRQHLPARPNSVRQYIVAHKTMTTADGKLRGRYGQPYAPATVELAVYVVSMVHQWLGYPNPVDHPKVTAQLQAYSKWWENLGFRADVSHALTPEENVRLVRVLDLSTLNGLRLATMIRLQFDTGARAAEICHIQMDDLKWQTADRVEVTISRSKTDQAGKGRVVAVEALRDVDWDVDPVRLLQAWYRCLQAAGYTSGPLFREVNAGPRRLDGLMAGSIKSGEMPYKAYEAAFNRAVAKSGVAQDPVTGKNRHITTHSNRAGHITAAADAGMPLEKVAPRTGHSPASKTIHRYFRSGRKWGSDNPGTLIRQAGRGDAASPADETDQARPPTDQP